MLLACRCQQATTIGGRGARGRDRDGLGRLRPGHNRQPHGQANGAGGLAVPPGRGDGGLGELRLRGRLVQGRGPRHVRLRERLRPGDGSSPRAQLDPRLRVGPPQRLSSRGR
jgi:hypothetical protein